MLVNPKKTTLMFFNPTKNRLCLPFCSLTDGEPLPFVSEARLLGLIMDDRLTWWPLVRDIVRRSRAKVWSLVKLRDAGATKEQLALIRKQLKQNWRSSSIDIICTRASISRTMHVQNKHCTADRLIFSSKGYFLSS